VKTHYRDLRLRINAGMDFPACYAGARLLDTDKGRLPSTSEPARVSCLKCRRIMAAKARRANG
jgi:hypothetical protein